MTASGFPLRIIPAISVVSLVLVVAAAPRHASGDKNHKPQGDISFLTAREREFYKSQWKPAIGDRNPKHSIVESLRSELLGITKWLSKEVKTRSGVSIQPIAIHVVSIDSRAKGHGIKNVERPRLSQDEECLFSWIRVEGPGASPKIIVSGVIRTMDDKSKATIGIYHIRRIFEYRGDRWVEQITSTDSVSTQLQAAAPGGEPEAPDEIMP